MSRLSPGRHGRPGERVPAFQKNFPRRGADYLHRARFAHRKLKPAKRL
jgi:hypothetical protein